MTSRAGLLALLALLGGCARQGFVAITVKLGVLTGKVDRLSLQAFDSRGDAGPMLVPSAGPVVGGIADDSVIAVSTPIGNALTVLVAGLGADGGVLGVGSASVASATTNTRVSITIAAPCAGPRDCDPAGECLGTVDCILGSCQAGPNQLAVAGSPCGPSDGGQCDGNGVCVLPYCGTGLQPLPPDEQCDQGVALNGNLPDHCRADCRLPSCGDGVTDPDAGELCDLGARNGQGLGCNATCNLLGSVAILAGSGIAESLDGIGLDAGFAEPGPLAVLAGGLFVGDQLSHLVRRIDLASLQVTTVAGGFDGGACHDTNGLGSQASFCALSAFLTYSDGLLVGDVSALRYLTAAGEVSTFAGELPNGLAAIPSYLPGPFRDAGYGQPLGLALMVPEIYSGTAIDGVVLKSDPLTMQVTVAATPFVKGHGGGLTTLNGLLLAGDSAGGVIASIDLDAGTVVDVANATDLKGPPQGLCSDGRGVYVSESGVPGVIQELVLDGGTGIVSLLAGGASGMAEGLGADAGFVQPRACAYDPVGRALYVSDVGSNLILVIH